MEYLSVTNRSFGRWLAERLDELVAHDVTYESVSGFLKDTLEQSRAAKIPARTLAVILMVALWEHDDCRTLVHMDPWVEAGRDGLAKFIEVGLRHYGAAPITATI